MQPLEILPSAPDSPLPQGSGWSNPLKDRSPAEQFDAFIGRALSRSSDTAPDDNETSDEPAPRRSRSDQNRKTSESGTTQPDSFAGADNSITPSLSQKAAATDGSGAKSENSPRVEGVGGTGQTAGAGAGSSATAAAGSASLAERVRGLLPAGDPKAQTLPVGLQTGLTPADGASGLQAGSADLLSAGDERTAGEGVGSNSMPGADGKTIVENHDADSAGKATNNGPIAAVQLISPGGSNGTGISSAQPQLPMQKAEKTNEFSASTEQNLPVSMARDAGEKLPTRAASATPSLASSEKSELSTTTGSIASGVTASTESASAPAESLHWPSSAPARSLERAHDLMSLHAFRLRDSGADSLQVVIKPGTGLQLSLNLQMRGGAMEMRATLHRGDFDFLSRHWSQLQQQLESRGIRLAPLTRSDDMAGGSNQQFQNPDHSPAAKDAAPAGALAEFTITNTLKPATVPRPRTVRGWESWA